MGGVSTNQLGTQVKVLESPLVLKPTYEFVKTNKTQKGENVKNWSFLEWRNNSLKVELQKGTSVLNIAYRDTDPDLVLPVIHRISNDYQLYSGRHRSESIRNALAFAKEQVDQFRKQAANSSRALDAFSIRYGISSSGESIPSTINDAMEMLGSNIDSNLLASSARQGRARGANTRVNRLGLNRQGDALSQLAAVNQELIRRKQQFTSRDPGVRALIRERDSLRRYIEMTAGGSLALPGKQPASKEQAQELMLKFKELKRTANRDMSTLNSLEGSLLSLQLEQARQTDPWELISTPTLIDKPVGPRKLRIVAFGLLSGLVLGCGAALINERRIGLVHSEEELKHSFTCNLLERLELKQTNTWTTACELLARGPLSEAQTIALVPVGQPDSNALNVLTKALQIALGDRSLLVSSDFVQTRGCDIQVLLAQPGCCSRRQLGQVQQSLALQGTPVAGWLLLDSMGEVV